MGQSSGKAHGPHHCLCGRHIAEVQIGKCLDRPESGDAEQPRTCPSRDGKGDDGLCGYFLFRRFCRRQRLGYDGWFADSGLGITLPVV